MAASSSSSSLHTIRHHNTKYDVFISFRGSDTRYSFTDHLFEALVTAGIKTFRNTKNPQDPKPETVIAESRASIVVLSKNYANSVSCLDELVLIMERRKRFYHIVVPIFYYDVDPLDVKMQKNSFELRLDRLGFENDIKLGEAKIERWKEALSDVANLSGKVLSGPETKFIADIVNTITNKLRLKLVSIPPHLTGMDTRAEDINFWLKDKEDAEVLAICGVAGSGKTTLAKYIYESNLPKFESSSFLEDIGKICEQPYGLCTLQVQLLAEILGDKKKELDVTSYKSQIEKALEKKKVLIVLDDIDKKEQLEALIGMEQINTKSKIIITSRLSSVQSLFGSTHHRCKEHTLKLLNEHESLELLCWHAFGSKLPMEGFKELALKAAQYCLGNPLALKMLGSLFVSAKDSRKRNNIEYWTNTLNLLEREPNYRIQGILRMSFEYLPFITYRELFLHIACFFVGEDEDYVVKILEPDYCATAGIVTLIDRCLLTVSPSKKLMMHGLFIEMARRMVVEESPTNPAKRSRIWSNDDSYTLLRQGVGSETIEGLALDMRMVREENHKMPSAFNADSLAKMDNLKLLQLNYVKLSGSYDDFPEDLRWLCWHGFHLGAVPSELFMGNLVAIDMSYSKLELFEPPMVIRPLKILNFKDSHSLVEIHNISRLPNLETLILWNCYSLVHVSEPIGELMSLAQLNMTGCEHLLKALVLGGQSPQLAFSFPHLLERLLLKSCNLDCNNNFLSFQEQSLLQHLHLGNNIFESLPDFNHLKSLRVLDLSFCTNLKCIHCLPSTLEELYITCCKSLEKVTFQSRRFRLQKIDYEGCTSLLEIEGLLMLVPISKIKETNLKHMKWLKLYQNHELCLIGDLQLTVGRSWYIQMLSEFGIMSTFLPVIKDHNITCEYMAPSSCLSFDVPPRSDTHMLIGLNVAFKYTLSGDEQHIWPIFAKLSMETYYLCRRDFFKSMEVDGPTPSWFRDSVGYKFDYTEIQGWRKTGRPQKLQP
uniref:disease resistance protein RPV1-like isoform X2 n=1 Tax=Erigeron canadensis TaxID=72917 RepID=UPI001CB9BD54|nr:disease resistance protein RPV1-like isoform X2 [Erigeron canadensis]